MTSKVAALAIACIGLLGTVAVASAAPKAKSKRHHTKSTTSGPTTSTPVLEAGDSKWVQGVVDEIWIAPNGRVTRLILLGGGTRHDMIFATTGCGSNGSLLIARHPELVQAWENGRRISIGIERPQTDQRRFCAMGVGLLGR